MRRVRWRLPALPRVPAPWVAGALAGACLAAALSACGPGGGGGDASPEALRPKTGAAPAASSATPAAAHSSPSLDAVFEQGVPRRGGTLRVAQPGDPASCDLHMSRGLSYQAVHPCNPMLSQIVRVDSLDHGVILPDLALSWELAEDGLTWTFRLRTDAVWHDGTPVTLGARERARRMGVADLLLLGVAETAVKRGSRHLTLEVRRSNTAAIALYSKHEFREMGVRKRYYSDNGEDAIIMTTPPIQSDAYAHMLASLARDHEERWGASVRVLA